MSMQHFRKYTLFLEQFYVQSKIEQKVQSFPIEPCPHVCPACLTIKIQHKSGHYVTINEPAWTHYSHLKFVVYSRVHSWYCFKDIVWVVTN